MGCARTAVFSLVHLLRPRDRKRSSSYKEKDPKRRHKDGRRKSRRKSYSPMRKRRRDSPSHLEARRITRWDPVLFSFSRIHRHTFYICFYIDIWFYCLLSCWPNIPLWDEWSTHWLIDRAIYLSACLPVCLSACLSICLPVCLSVYHVNLLWLTVPTAPGRDPFPTSGPVRPPAAGPAACLHGAVGRRAAATGRTATGPTATGPTAAATGPTATGPTAAAPPGTPSSGLGAASAEVPVT